MVLSGCPAEVTVLRGRRGARPEGGDRGGERREDPVVADPGAQPAAVQVDEQVLLDPRQRRFDAAAVEFVAQRVQRIGGGDVEFHDRFGVEQQPRGRWVGRVDGGEGAAAEVLGVGEAQGAS
jgi:hypothetical protein